MREYYALIPESDTLEHHGVKGMKWGVRRERESLGSRYKRWAKKVSNRSYDKKIASIERNRKAKLSKPLFKDTKYGKWANEQQNKRYDKMVAKVEARRNKRMSELDKIGRSKQRRYDRSDYAEAKSLTNQELEARTRRINLEQNYINALERDRTSYRDATSSYVAKIGRKTVRALDKKILNIGASTIDIGAEITKNTVKNKANKYLGNSDDKKKK